MGNFTSIEKGSTWQVKLEIKPKANMSLQMHKYRSEHWVIVNGIAKVEINGNILLKEMKVPTYQMVQSIDYQILRRYL